MRDSITLICGSCESKNYRRTVRKGQGIEKLVVNKFCKFCRKRTQHKEHKK